MFASGKDAISRGGATGNVGKLWRVKEQKSIRDDPSSSFRTIIVDRVRSVRGPYAVYNACLTSKKCNGRPGRVPSDLLLFSNPLLQP